MKNQSYTMALNSLAIEAEAISQILRYLNKEAFSKAVDAMSNCDKIITSGCGGSGIAMEKFTHSLCCIERSSLFLSPSKAVHGGLGCVKANDVVMVLSRGGKTSELIPIVDVAKKIGATVITLTENLNSILAEKADIVVPFQVEKESDKLNIMTTSSFIIAAALCDAFLAAIMEETNYKIEQFALIHPGGAVGEFLNK